MAFLMDLLSLGGILLDLEGVGRELLCSRIAISILAVQGFRQSDFSLQIGRHNWIKWMPPIPPSSLHCFLAGKAASPTLLAFAFGCREAFRAYLAAEDNHLLRGRAGAYPARPRRGKCVPSRMRALS